MTLISGKSLAEKTSSFIIGLMTICPLLLAVVCALPNFFGGWGLVWDGHPYDFYFLPDIKHHLLGGVVLACIWGACFVLFCRSRFFVDTRHLPLKLFLIALVSRAAIALTIGQFASPISDFSAAWERACTGVVSTEAPCHLLFPAWMSFSMFERCWVLLFGSNMGGGLLVGAFFNAVTAMMMFYFVRQMFKESRVAFVAASLYVFYPSSIVYVVTVSPEHMCVACFMTMAVLLSKCFSTEISCSRRVLLAIGAGLAAGFGNSVKPIFGVYGIVTAVCVLTAILRSEKCHMASCVDFCSVFFVFIAAEICVSSMVVRCTEAMFHVTLRSVNPTPHFLCVGLNRQGEGQIHVGQLSRTWHTMVSNGVSSRDATRITYEIVAQDWKEHAGEAFSFLMKKLVWTWQDDNRPYGLAVLQLGKGVATQILDDADREAMGQVITKRELGVDDLSSPSVLTPPSQRALLVDFAWQSVQTAGFVLYVSIMLLAVVGVWNDRQRCRFNFCYNWVTLFVLGFSCLLVISEASGRYKCVVMPYIFMLVAPILSRLILRRQN